MSLSEKAVVEVDREVSTNRSSRWWLRHDASDVVIEALPERVYEMVADLPRMGEWSPECQRVEWLEGSNGPSVGARFIGHNRGGPGGLLKWSRRGRVLTAEPGQRVRLRNRRRWQGRGRMAIPLRAHRGRYPCHRVLRDRVDPDMGPHRRRSDEPLP